MGYRKVNLYLTFLHIIYFSCLHKKSNKRMHKLFSFLRIEKSLIKKEKIEVYLLLDFLRQFSDVYRQLIPSARILYVETWLISIYSRKDCLLIKHGSSVFQVNYQLWFYFLSVFLMLFHGRQSEFIGDTQLIFLCSNFLYKESLGILWVVLSFMQATAKQKWMKTAMQSLVLFLCKQEKYRKNLITININFLFHSLHNYYTTFLWKNKPFFYTFKNIDIISY